MEKITNAVTKTEKGVQVIFRGQAYYFQNEELASYTNLIFSIGDGMRKSTIQTAKILQKVDDAKAFEKDGFKSTADYAEQIFGFGKASTSTLVRASRAFINDDLTEKFSNPNPEKPFTMGQLVELLRLKDENRALELLESGEINSEMSQKEIRTAVKGMLALPASATEAEENEAENTEDVTPETEVKALTPNIEKLMTEIRGYLAECIATGADISKVVVNFYGMEGKATGRKEWDI